MDLLTLCQAQSWCSPHLPTIFNVFAVVISVMIGATILVRVIPGDEDDKAVSKAKAWLLSVLHFLPTLGTNPQTKALIEKLEEQEAPKNDAKAA